MGTTGPVASTRGTVVVIDDSVTALTAITKWLEDEGFEVVALSRSLGATRTIMHVRPSVLLLDIKLPGLSGDRLAIVLSQNPATASVPIIFYSQIDPAELKRLTHECAVVGAISKTGDRAAFIREFEKLSAPFLGAPPSVAPTSRSLPRLLPDPPLVGIAEVDEQHKRIMDMLRHISMLIRDIRELEAKPALRRDLRESMLKIIVFVRFHLTIEDRYMREVGHPGIAEHRAAHGGYLDATSTIEGRITEELSAEGLVDAARELRRLVQEHMWSTDPDLKACGA